MRRARARLARVFFASCVLDSRPLRDAISRDATRVALPPRLHSVHERDEEERPAHARATRARFLRVCIPLTNATRRKGASRARATRARFLRVCIPFTNATRRNGVRFRVSCPSGGY